jgi:endoglucanase
VFVALALVALALGVGGSGRAADPPAARAARPTSGCVQYGVNLSAAEFVTVPGTYGNDYIYPGIDSDGFNNAWEMAYFHSKGLNLVRLPVQWERVQPTLNGALSAFDLARIDMVLANAAAQGMTVIIGPHNFGRRTISGTDYLIGSPQVPYAAFTDFWQRMAAHFAGHAGLYGYSLDNEPHDMNGLWVTGGAQAGINGIRQSDATAPILVPGDGWSGAWTWVGSGNDPLRTLSDPANNLIFDAHQYFDDDGSGTYALSYDQQGAYPAIGVDRLQPFVTWLHTYNLRGMITEYGVPNDDARWYTVMDNALTYLDQNNDVSLGGDWWSAGPWWGPSYRLSVEPSGTWPNVTDRAQMPTLAAHTNCVNPTPTPTPPPNATPTPTVAGCQVQFSDVPQGSTFYDFVRCLACQGIVGGYPDGTFGVNNPVTRGQLAKFVSNAAGYGDTIPPTQQTFSDVPPDSAFWLYVERAALHGVIGGYADGTFRAGASVTRGQTAKFVSNAAGYNDTIPPTQQTFSDVPPDYIFWVYIERVAANGVVGGYSDGTFRPTNSVTRGQTAKFISSAFFPGCSP